MEFENGEAKAPLKQIGTAKGDNGTQINFIPSQDIFSSTKFSFSILEKRLRELAFLNKGIKISLINNFSKKNKSLDFKYDGGIIEFVEHLDKKRDSLKNKNGNELFKKPIYLEENKSNLNIQCSLKWNAGYSEDVYPFTNNIYQKDGGTHLLGFRSALTRVINKYASDLNLLKKINYLSQVMM